VWLECEDPIAFPRFEYRQGLCRKALVGVDMCKQL
jgi:hypothetical protein